MSRRTVVGALADTRILVPSFVLIGLFGLWLSTRITNPYTQLFPVALILSSVVFFLATKMADSRPFRPVGVDARLLLVPYLVTLSATLVSYGFTGTRTLSIHVGVFLLYILSGLSIVSLSSVSVSLSLIILSGVVDRVTGIYSSALFTGIDNYTHNRYAETIASEGSLDALLLSKYYYAPIYHVEKAIGKLVLDVGVQDSTVLVVTIPTVVITAAVILVIVQQFWSSSTGLVGALLYTAGDFSILRGIYTMPMTFGAVFVSLVFIATIYYLNGQDKRWLLVLLVFTAVLTGTHQASLFIAITLVGSYLAFHLLYGEFSSRTAVNIVLIGGLAMIADFMLTLKEGPWGEQRTFFESSVELMVTEILSASPTSRGAGNVLPPDTALSFGGAAGMTLIHVLGSALLISFAVIGALYWLERKSDTVSHSNGWAIGGAAAIMLGVSLSGPAVGISYLLPTRWFTFIYIPLSILAAPGVVLVSRAIPDGIWEDKRRVIAVCILLTLIPYVLIMGGNMNAAPYDPLYDDAPAAERMSVTESEKQLVTHTDTYADTDTAPVVADARLEDILARYYGTENADRVLVDYDDQENPIESPTYLLYRPYLESEHAYHTIRYQDTEQSVHGEVPIDEIEPTNQAVIYDNGKNDLRLIKGDE